MRGYCARSAHLSLSLSLSLSLHRQVRWRPSGRPRSTTPRWMWRTCCRICIARSTMCKRCLRPPRNAHRLTFATSSQKEARVERDPLLRTRAQLQRAISDEDYYRAADFFRRFPVQKRTVRAITLTYTLALSRTFPAKSRPVCFTCVPTRT